MGESGEGLIKMSCAKEMSRINVLCVWVPQNSYVGVLITSLILDIGAFVR
jgi:hypothetical protein